MSSVDGTHLLIVGSPRSGTTLLSAMLGCHPEIALLNEDLYGGSLTILSKKVRGVKLCMPNQIELEQSEWMRLEDFIISSLQKVLRPIRIQLGLRSPIIRGKKSKLSIRDYQKSTEKLFILGIIRNPHDSINSIMKRGGQSKGTAERRWQRIIDVLHRLSMEDEKSEDDTLLIVDFDKLVNDPVGIMKQLLPFFECEFNEDVLQGYKHTPQYKGSAIINAGKASKGIDHALTHPVLQSNETLRNKYLHLLEKCI